MNRIEANPHLSVSLSLNHSNTIISLSLSLSILIIIYPGTDCTVSAVTYSDQSDSYIVDRTLPLRIVYDAHLYQGVPEAHCYENGIEYAEGTCSTMDGAYPPFGDYDYDDNVTGGSGDSGDSSDSGDSGGTSTSDMCSYSCAVSYCIVSVLYRSLLSFLFHLPFFTLQHCY